jgi:hypothetical protein
MWLACSSRVLSVFVRPGLTAESFRVPKQRGTATTLTAYLWCLFLRFFFPRLCGLDLAGAP